MSINGVTNVYTIQHGEEYEWMLPIDADDYESLIFDGKPRGSSWDPIRMHRLRFIDGQFRQPCDFPYGSGGTYLIMSEAAKEKSAHI